MTLFYQAHSLHFSMPTGRIKELEKALGPAPGLWKLGPRVVFPPRRNMGWEWYIISSLSKETQSQQFPGHLPSAN